MPGDPEFNGTYVGAMDPVTGASIDLATFPGVSDYVLSFVVGNKGYVITGSGGNNKTIWEYNFAANTWTNKGTSPLGKRKDAVAFVVNNKVYMGLGYETATINGQSLKIYINNWVEYDPATGTSVAKTPFPGSGRGKATGFLMGSSAYLGFGKGISGYLKDFWRYSPGSDTWTQQDSWPGVTPIANNMVGFSQGTTGYVIKAALNEYWRFSRSSLIPVPTPTP
jgi:N-acetylneuraminic acid mutarotase